MGPLLRLAFAVLYFSESVCAPSAVEAARAVFLPQTGESADAAATLEERARAAMEQGHPREALTLLERAPPVTSKAGDAASEARLELLRSRALRSLAELERAKAAAEHARSLAKRAAAPALEARALVQMATLARDRGEIESSGSVLELALGLAERSGDGAALAEVLLVLGERDKSMGRTEEALAHFSRAITWARRTGDDRIVLRALTFRSTTYLVLARYDEALADAQQARDLGRQVADRSLQASSIFALAQVEAHLWNLDRAASLWTEAMEAYARAGIQIGVALAKRQRMETWYALGDLERAAADGKAALDLFQRSGSGGTLADLVARLALIESKRGHFAASRRYEKRAGQLLPSSTPVRRVYVLLDLGLVALAGGRLSEAESRFEDVLERARAVGNVEYEWRAREGLGRVALRRQEPREAQAHFDGAIELVDRLRRAVPAARTRAAMLSGRIGPYEGRIQSLEEQASSPNDAMVRRALETAESARGRTMADLLAESRAHLSDPEIVSARKEEDALSRRFTDLQSKLMEADDAGERRKWQSELDQAELDYEALVVRIRREHPAYGALSHPSSLSAEAISELLEPDEALVEFALSDSVGFAWIVRSGGRIFGYRVPGRESFEQKIRLLHGLVAGDEEAGLRKLASELYDDLLAPGALELKGARRLLVVPDGALRRLPFALLRSGNGNERRWLIEDVAVQLAPSASLLRELRAPRSRRPARTLLAIGVSELGATSRYPRSLYGEGALPSSPLVNAEKEALEVADELGGGTNSVRTGVQASEKTLKTIGVERYRILHFATHSLLDEVVPRRSAILLRNGDGEDGLLQINEIVNLHLNADLVVLATCRSYLGKEIRGEGLLSLSRAFTYAGARAVLATLWSVEDGPTRDLMRQLYRRLGDGARVDDALRGAQLAMLRAGGSDAKPASWAGFVLSGDASYAVLAPRRRLAPLLFALALLALAGIVLRRRLGRAHR